MRDPDEEEEDLFGPDEPPTEPKKRISKAEQARIDRKRYKEARQVLVAPGRPGNAEVCGARNKSRGGRCGAIAMPNGRCRRHGGTAVGRPITKGKGSARLKRIRKMMNRALKNPNILDLKPTLAAMDVRVRELFGRLPKGDSPHFRDHAKILIDKYVEELRASEHEDAREGEYDPETHLNNLYEWIHSGQAEGEVWREALTLMERRSVRTEKAIDAVLKGQQAVTQRDLVVVLGSVVSILRAECRDGALVSRILTRLDREVLGDDASYATKGPANKILPQTASPRDAEFSVVEE